jgi:hypothetical protein
MYGLSYESNQRKLPKVVSLGLQVLTEGKPIQVRDNQCATLDDFKEEEGRHNISGALSSSGLSGQRYGKHHHR